jgi:hypothetical protein
MEMKRQNLPHPFRHGHGATGHFARPAIRHGCGNLMGQEIFSANRDFHQHSIQRILAFHRQRAVFLWIGHPILGTKRWFNNRSANLQLR